MKIRDIKTQDYEEILALNEESVHYLSPIDHSKLKMFLQQAKYKKVIEKGKRIAAFILAFDMKAKYDSPNYLWFRERYRNFLYIDRIVVGKQYQGQGIGDLLYNEIKSYAKHQCYKYITCEINIEPPNIGSLRFHEKHKFIEVGTQWVKSIKKQVSLRELKIE